MGDWRVEAVRMKAMSKNDLPAAVASWVGMHTPLCAHVHMHTCTHKQEQEPSCNKLLLFFFFSGRRMSLSLFFPFRSESPPSLLKASRL